MWKIKDMETEVNILNSKKKKKSCEYQTLNSKTIKNFWDLQKIVRSEICIFKFEKIKCVLIFALYTPLKIPSSTLIRLSSQTRKTLH